MAFGEIRIRFTAPGSRPTMTELVHHLWGPVAFNSDGDCSHPNSTNWKELTVENREGGGRVDVDISEEEPLVLVVRGKDRKLVAKAARYLAEISGGQVLDD